MSFFGGDGEGGGLKGIVSALCAEKNLEKAVVIDALEQAVLHAARKDFGAEADIEATYNEETDEIELFQFRGVVEELSGEAEDEFTAPDMSLEEARKLDPEIEVGDSLGVKIDIKRFGRIAAQSAKQIIVQKVRDAERAQIFEEYKDRVGEVLAGNIRRFEGQDIIVDLGRVEAVVPKREQMSGERFRVKDRVQAYVVEIKRASRGPQIILSRAHPGFLVSLFHQNVAEIYDGIVNVEAAARDAGHRSKIAVHSKDPAVDPVGACVGMKGARVQAVVQELNGEKIDIVPWDNDPAKLVCNALAPAVVSKVIVDDQRHAMEVIVAEDQLSLAIGKRGQNVRLAAQLTGWRLDIKSEAKLEEQLAGVKSVLSSIDGLGDMHAGILVHEGIKTPEELAELGTRALCRLLNLDDESAEKVIEGATLKAAELREASDSLVNSRFGQGDSGAEPETKGEIERIKAEHERAEKVEVFMRLRGVGEATAFALAEAGYGTIGDIIADSADEVAQKAGVSLGIARTVQIAADRYLQENSAGTDDL